MTDLRDALKRASGVADREEPDHMQIAGRTVQIVRRRRITYSALGVLAAAVIGFSAVQVAEGSWFAGSQDTAPATQPTPTSRPTETGSPGQIEVETPQPGDAVSSPVTVAGDADVFEANVGIQILDEDDHVLKETFATADCGSGCRGDYSREVSFAVDREQPGTVRVYSESARTGKPEHIVNVPVILLPQEQRGSTQDSPIVVDSPKANDAVESPFTVSGTADVFEGTVSIRIRDEDGNVLAETFTTASCSTGCRGDYSRKVKFEVTEFTAAVIEVYSVSAETGEDMFTQKIPVILLPPEG